jgi:hypothetical protein
LPEVRARFYGLQRMHFHYYDLDMDIDTDFFFSLSNCKAPSGRHHYIQELMKYIPVDSYGKCLHNKDVPKNFPGRFSSNDLSYLSTLIKDYKVLKFRLGD